MKINKKTLFKTTIEDMYTIYYTYLIPKQKTLAENAEEMKKEKSPYIKHYCGFIKKYTIVKR